MGLVRIFPVSSNRGILPQHSDMGARVPGDGLSCILRMCACSGVSGSLQPHGLQPTRLLCPWNSPGKNTGMDCHSLLQGILPTQGTNPHLLYCRQILYYLSHQGSPNTYMFTSNPASLSGPYILLQMLPCFSSSFYSKIFQERC